MTALMKIMTFDDCEWLDDYSETGYQVIPADGGSGRGGSGYCFSSCPKDKVRVAMEHYNTCNKKTGSRAKCCSPNYTTTQKKVDPMVELWTADLKNWLENPTCSTGYGTATMIPLVWATIKEASQTCCL